jgi:hypothetical protein
LGHQPLTLSYSRFEALSHLPHNQLRRAET